jgi:hypothetical protein
MVGQSTRIQVDNHLILLLQQPMELAQYMSIHLVHRLLHQPIPCLVRRKGDVSRRRSYCWFKKCAGLKIKKKIIRPYKTVYQCEKCTVEKGHDFWLCHTTKKTNGKQTVVSCHLKYHTEMCFSSTGSATESSVTSRLTDE